MSKYISGTSFDHITVHGMTIVRTAFGDGFDTGDILVRDTPGSDGRPEFFVVIDRTVSEAEVAEVNTLVSVRDFSIMDATARPALGVTVTRTIKCRIGDGMATLPDGGGTARPWDGNTIPVAA